MNTKFSIFPYLIIGIGLGGVLSIGYNSWESCSFFDYFVGFYGIFYLLAIPYSHQLKRLCYTTLLPALLACLPFVFHQAQHAFSAIFLAIISGYMLNGFHIHYLKHRWKLHYSTLFYAVWDSWVKLMAIAFFTALCWIILLLTGSLFSLIKITFLKAWIDNNSFGIFCVSIFSALGFYLTTKTERVLQQIRGIFLFLFRMLFVPLSAIGIIFILSAIGMYFTSQHFSLDHATLATIAFLSVIFANAVYEDGKTHRKIPSFIVYQHRIFLILTPLFTLLALYAIIFHANNNIAANGLTRDNFACLLSFSLLLLYNLAYAIIACRFKKPWMLGVEKINVVLACIVVATTVIAFSPLLSYFIPQITMVETPQ